MSILTPEEVQHELRTCLPACDQHDEVVEAVGDGTLRLRLPFRDLFCRHFYITTSGNFSSPALLCSLMEMGVDRILFSVDWPYVENAPGVQWMQHVPLGAEDREKILNRNAARLLRLE